MNQSSSVREGPQPVSEVLTADKRLLSSQEGDWFSAYLDPAHLRLRPPRFLDGIPGNRFLALHYRSANSVAAV